MQTSRGALAPPGYALLSWQGWRVLLHRRAWAAGAALLILLLAAGSAILAAGSEGLTPWSALRAAWGQGDPMHVFLVQALRLPRIAAALLSGFAFGVAGCLLQTLTGNRLATPGVIGLDNGATAFAVASIVAVPASLAPPAMALMGAATAAALAFGLGGGSGTRGYRFVVVGIGVGAVFAALTNLMLARTGIDAANQAYPWTVGSLNARPASAVWILAAGLALAFPWAKYLARRLDPMRFSEAVAKGLGVPVARTRAATLAAAVLLSALSVSVAGPVGLVALAAPEAARYLCGRRGVPIATSGLAGAMLMLGADWAGRTWFAPIEIPVGVVTAVVGGPYLLWILLRRPARHSL
ncbi:FecCD family ABC transporter permease [Pigmentiphaga humi]|uniref:FecCD family ABC transporter permease n=1 Tax=Pigmentiphaga humi TaxID=2478468 RepID=UPI001CA4336B|nr:iron ABC transporter permease [Pigmentiphaga humi]